MLSLADGLATQREDPKQAKRARSGMPRRGRLLSKGGRRRRSRSHAGAGRRLSRRRESPPTDAQAASLVSARGGVGLARCDAGRVLAVLRRHRSAAKTNRSASSGGPRPPGTGRPTPCTCWHWPIATASWWPRTCQVAPVVQPGRQRKNTRAMCLLEQICLDGEGVQKDEKTAVSWFQAAATLGSGEALTAWGCSRPPATAALSRTMPPRSSTSNCRPTRRRGGGLSSRSGLCPGPRRGEKRRPGCHILSTGGGQLSARSLRTGGLVYGRARRGRTQPKGCSGIAWRLTRATATRCKPSPTLYHSGTGVAKDEQQSADWAKKAAAAKTKSPGPLPTEPSSTGASPK